MVRKLLKYDFMAFAKVMIPVEIGVLIIAAVYRFVALFESRSTSYQVFNASTIIILVVGMIVATAVCFIFSIVRFYKNLFTQEGYLSHTLPVSASAHIISKIIVAIVFDLITVITILLAASIAMSGDVFAEVLKAGAFLFGRLTDEIGAHAWLFVIEGILLLAVIILKEHNVLYACVSIGQVAKKHKILLALGIYFGIYIVRQLIGTLLVTLGLIGNFFAELENFLSNYPLLSGHVFLITSIFVELVLTVIYFFITRYMIKNKLNLE